MIKEIKSKSKTPNWNEKITLELTLRDLQIIYDAVGSIPPIILKDKHEKRNSSLFHDNVTYNASTLIDNIYSELENILTEYNGIIDY